MTHSHEIIGRLMHSFEELEKAIQGARIKLETRGSTPASVLKRLDSYQQILTSQKSMALELSGHIAAKNIVEVRRMIKLIGAMSDMIMRDARDIISSLNGQTAAIKSEEDEINFC